MEPINMLGKPCPLPVIEAKRALKLAAAGESVSILVDNDIARQNLQKLAADLGHGFQYEPAEGGGIVVAITAAVGLKTAAAGPGAGLVVAIGREVMGGGDDELGRALMKSFIHSLTELDVPPERLFFFNGGVRLTAKGSAALDDLAALAERGAAIDSCGACLNYYHLTDQVAIGGVTNMYAIAEGLARAGKVINL